MTKILLVEDDKSLREIYGVRLLAEGYDIVSAGDGEEALAMAIKDLPALILSDVMMPKISGFDMLDILRSTTETRNIKVIMMTALSSEDQRKRGEQLGADRYLVKSQVGIEDVVRTVHEVLNDAPVATPANPYLQQSPAPSASSTMAPSYPDRTAITPPPRMADQPQTPLQPTATPQQIVVQSASQPMPQAEPSAEPVQLPQPTAPFSTPRQTNLAGRVIQPLPVTVETDKVSDLMQQELESHDRPIQQQSTIQADNALELELQQAITNPASSPQQMNTPPPQTAPQEQYTAPQQQPIAIAQPAPFAPQPPSNTPSQSYENVSAQEQSLGPNTPSQQQ